MGQPPSFIKRCWWARLSRQAHRRPLPHQRSRRNRLPASGALLSRDKYRSPRRARFTRRHHGCTFHPKVNLDWLARSSARRLGKMAPNSITEQMSSPWAADVLCGTDGTGGTGKVRIFLVAHTSSGDYYSWGDESCGEMAAPNNGHEFFRQATVTMTLSIFPLTSNHCCAGCPKAPRWSNTLTYRAVVM